MLRPLLLTLAFVVELLMLAAFFTWGLNFRWGAGAGWTCWLLAVGAPVLVAVLWGLFLAPVAARPLGPGPHLALELLLYLLAALGLIASGRPLPGWSSWPWPSP